MDETTGADVHPDVPNAVEEDEIAGTQGTAGDAVPEVEVRVGAMRQVEPEVGVHVADKPRAVEAAGG